MTADPTATDRVGDEERRINNERLYKMVDEIHQAVFRGNGTPGLVVRVGVLEAEHAVSRKQSAAQWGGMLGIVVAVVLDRLGIRVH